MLLWHVWQMCRFWPITGQQRLKPHPLLLWSKNQDVESRESGAVVWQQGPEFNCFWGPGAFWTLHLLIVPMWDSKLTLDVCGCLFLDVSSMMSPLTTESGTQEWWRKEKEWQGHKKVWNDWRQIDLVYVCQVFVRAVACFTLEPLGPDSLSRSVLSKNCLQLSR